MGSTVKDGQSAPPTAESAHRKPRLDPFKRRIECCDDGAQDVGTSLRDGDGRQGVTK